MKGGKLALQAFACGPEQGGVHIEADDGLPGFQLVYAGPPAERRPVIRTFAKAADAPLEAILPGFARPRPARRRPPAPSPRPRVMTTRTRAVTCCSRPGRPRPPGRPARLAASRRKRPAGRWGLGGGRPLFQGDARPS
uniref:Uncharacterized protein n=1 Tax=Phenylobacterium glaciei TaxID=2803784 RepID=A0A974P2L2_9CAUL|nr:hypothetical protein JKL49_26365 [Phenylobacterium glaciei]